MSSQTIPYCDIMVWLGATRLDKISTPKQMFCAKEWKEKGEWLFNNIAAYAEFPPLVPPIMAKAYPGERKKAGGFMVATDSNVDIVPPMLRPDIDENDMKMYTEIAKSLDIDPTLKDDMSYMQFMCYNQICHLELLPTSVKSSSVNAEVSWYERTKPILAEFPPIERRLDFLNHIEKLPSFKTAIEVGVQKGILAKKSLDIWKSCTEYNLVDLWGKEEGYNEPGTDTAADKDANLRQARGRMKRWVEMGKVKFFVMRSTDAAKHLANNHFDFIYLDARHDYCAVKEDIEHYWPKLRPGGILGGHDYIDAQYAIDKLGAAEDWSKCEDGSVHPEAVRGAVDEFREQNGDLQIYTSNEDFPSWYVQKPYQ